MVKKRVSKVELIDESTISFPNTGNYAALLLEGLSYYPLTRIEAKWDIDIGAIWVQLPGLHRTNVLSLFNYIKDNI